MDCRKCASKNKFLSIVVIFFISLIFVSGFYLLLPQRLRINTLPDYYHSYYPAAKNFISGKGLLGSSGEILTRYPPIHPVLMAGFIQVSHFLRIDEELGLLGYIWLSFASCSITIYLISSMFWVNWYRYIPVVLWITYIPALWLAKQPNSGIPFTAIFLLSIYFLINNFERKNPPSSWLFGFSGLLLGFSMLTRPIVFLVGLVVPIFILSNRSNGTVGFRIKWAGIFVAFAFLPAILWGIYLKSETGKFVFLSLNGLHSIKDGLTFAIAKKGYREEITLPRDVVKVMEHLFEVFSQNKIQSIGQLSSLMIDEFVKYPSGIIQLIGIKLLRSWYGLDSMRYEKAIFAYQLPYMVAISLSLYFSFKKRVIKKHYLFLLLAIVTVFWGMTTLVLSILRYMTPVFSILFLCVPSLLIDIHSVVSKSSTLRNEKALFA